jgi:hypothetical protein
MAIKTLAGAAVLMGGGAVVYRELLRRPILNLGRDRPGVRGAATGRRATRGRRRRCDARGHDRRARLGRVAVDRADGPSPRGGAYTYDWIENLLGLNMHSAHAVLPDYQHPQIGEGFGYGANKMSYRIVEPEHVIATQSADGNWVWSFILDEQDGRTRLISRNRFRLPRLRDKIGMTPMEPGSLVMERKMLYGIKQRAEKLASQQKESPHA